jgi:aminopyrrolnitrin oxygenase
MKRRTPALLAWPGKEHAVFAARKIALICALFLLVYGGANYLTAIRAHKLHLFLAAELAIPLWPVMILPYDSIYLSFLLAPLILRTKEEIERLAAAAVVVIAIAGLGFLLLPAELGFPPPRVTGPLHTIFVISDEINLDYNLVPSLHVGLAFLCIQAFAIRARMASRILLAIWAAVIALSTLLTHQHHIIDVVTGAVLARVVFLTVYLRREKYPVTTESILCNEHRLKPTPRLPLFPASWYLFGAASNVTSAPVAIKALGKELVAFRGQNGCVALMDARCSHFGASLAEGKVIGDAIECPYHGWRYGMGGQCEKIPSNCVIPAFARQTVYPVEERHGYLFFFNGPTPTFPLPWFLDDETVNDYVAGRPFQFTATAPWPSVTGHAFDLQHFLYVHDRRLLEPPTIDVPRENVRRIRYRAEIVPNNWRDKTLAKCLGREVNAALVIWGGTFATVTARFQRSVSRFFMIMQPINRQETLCQGIALAPKSRRWELGVRRFFTRAYLEEENRTLQGTLSLPHRFVESDKPLREYFDFLKETQHIQGELL